ncbi:MAG: Mur ligase family protein [Chitinophagales bacterium]|jgi:UDP-N-acetylmuramate: L-alanyl-gamma-D-glutamyl-meso-diaminopimelate ligase|nr:Mur ligase family protein [Chitinophagales bacterium]
MQIFDTPKNIHFIAIGGAIMHQLAISMKQLGHHITGSDDIIEEPSRSNLGNHGLLPEKLGFFSEYIHADLDVIILGMHAKLENPELTKAMELGLKVISFPEFIYELSKNKKRILVAGSHGKTTITSMIMHVLKRANFDFDYLVGARVAGFEKSVQISQAPIIILEADEYLSSCLDMRPKFLYYKGNLAVISGIEWDHINVFPTLAQYQEQFKLFIQSLENKAQVFFHNSEGLADILSSDRNDIILTPYIHQFYDIEDGIYYIKDEGKHRVSVFGQHNMANIEAAKQICLELGMSKQDFYQAISDFQGAKRRLEQVNKFESSEIIRDFAHSPSKLRATINAASEKFANQNILAIYELHTFSSLKEDFLPMYRDTLAAIKAPVVFLDTQVLQAKGGKIYTEVEVKAFFNHANLKLITNLGDLKNYIEENFVDNTVLLMMSSGNFAGLDISKLQPSSALSQETSKQADFDKSKKINEPKSTLNEGHQRNNELIKIIAMTYGLFILAPIYYLIRYENSMNELEKNSVKQILNFELIVLGGLFLGLIFSWFFPLTVLYYGILLVIRYKTLNFNLTKYLNTGRFELPFGKALFN